MMPPVEIGPDAPRNFLRMLEHRELIRLQKQAGVPYPWTEDPILGKFKFTNVKRHHDRTTKALVDEFYEPHRDSPWAEILLNCAIFRYFGTIEFARAIGWTPLTFDAHRRERIMLLARTRLGAGERVFTGAYVITNGGIARPKEEVVVEEYLVGFWERLPSIAATWGAFKRWEKVAECMAAIPGFGGTGFMTKEVLQDAMLTPAMADAVDAASWTPIGPGAARGLARVLGRRPAGPRAALEELLKLREWVNSARDPGILPELTAHDIQFQLCEFDKYMRVYLGEGKPRSLYHPKET